MHRCACSKCDAPVLHGLADEGAWEVRLDLRLRVDNQVVEDTLCRLKQQTYEIWEWPGGKTEAVHRMYSIYAQPGWEGSLCDMTYKRLVLAVHKCGETK